MLRGPLRHPGPFPFTIIPPNSLLTIFALPSRVYLSPRPRYPPIYTPPLRISLVPSPSSKSQLSMEPSDWVKGKLIGKGSFGSVSLAYDKLGRRVFAVKSVPLDSRAVPSLENEIEILRSLNSAYVVSYLGDSTTGGSRNLHIEHVPGGTLADAAGSLGEREVRALTRCVASGLHYLHSVAGVVHSDVKGRNVLLGPGPGRAKLADFGSARRVSDGRPAVGGTPLWMAPEVIRGSPATAESDVWSLGCTVIEMVTGGSPWSDSRGAELLEIGFGGKVPEFPAKLSRLGHDFLDKCLRRRPEERWTAEELLRHPFLEAEAAPELSPRCVLDWVSSGFDDGDEEEEEEADDDLMRLGTERIRGLAGDSEGTVNWDGEGWELVRARTQEEASGNEPSNEIGGSSGFDFGCCHGHFCCCDQKQSCLNWSVVLFH